MQDQDVEKRNGEPVHELRPDVPLTIEELDRWRQDFEARILALRAKMTLREATEMLFH